ncbi:MAG TPA: hypothetical protein VH186_12960 [Chloroflexia bacterium]|nr:hypothetical protein [Chloroflexia bacterium]
MISRPHTGNLGEAAKQLLVKRVAAYLPPIALPDPGAVQEKFKGAVLSTSLEGFVALADSLVKTGREGAEALTRILNSYLGEVNQILVESNGQILDFDGLDLLAFFPEDLSLETPDALERAGFASQALLKLNNAFPPVQTSEGRFGFQMKTGLAEGELLLTVLGSDMLGRTLLFSGTAVDQARMACLRADWGEALRWNEQGLWPVESDETASGSKGSSSSYSFGEEELLSIFNRLATYLPRQLAQRLKSQPDVPLHGEFRRVVNIFLQLPGLDLEQPGDLETLKEYFLTVQGICTGLDGRVHQVVPLPDQQGVRLYLAFGALSTNSDDAEHALRAALALRELPVAPKVLPTLGIASGNVYTGSIGTDQRQKYIILGDVVSLSALFSEAAASEEPGTLLVDRYTRERVGLSYLFGGDLILNLASLPFPVRASRLLSPRPQVCSLATFVREYAPSGSLMTGRLGLIEEAFEGTRQVILVNDTGHASYLAHRWYKRDGAGAAGTCLPNASTVPYVAWSSLLGGLVGLNETDSRTEKAAKLSQAVARYAPDHIPLTNWLNQLMGLTLEEPDFRRRVSGQQRDLFFRLVIDLVKGMAETKPLLLIFRDLQWSDEPGLLLLEQVVGELENAPVLFCLTAQHPDAELQARLNALCGA